MRRVSGVAIIVTLLASLPAVAASTGSFERTLKVSGAVQLEVKSGSGDITIRKGDVGSVRVYGRIRAGEGWFGGGDASERVRHIEQDPPIDQAGNIIRIGHHSESEWFKNVSISYEIVTPAETQVTASSGSGNVQVENVRGPAELHAGSGNVTAANIGSDVRADTGSGNMDLSLIQGNLFAHAGSGEIKVERVGNADVQAGSGNIRVTDMKGRLRAHAGSGNLKIDGIPTGDWYAQTGSGNVTLRLPSDGGFDVRIHTGSGGIESDQPITIQGRQGKHDLEGKVRGGGPLVEVHTGSGEVHLR